MNLVTYSLPYLVIHQIGWWFWWLFYYQIWRLTKLGDDSGDKFGNAFGDSQLFLTNLMTFISPFLSPNLLLNLPPNASPKSSPSFLNHQISHQICHQIRHQTSWAPICSWDIKMFTLVRTNWFEQFPEWSGKKQRLKIRIDRNFGRENLKMKQVFLSSCYWVILFIYAAQACAGVHSDLLRKHFCR